MKWVKQSVGYWCDDIKQGRCIGQGVCVALLDTGIARHPDLKGSVVKFCDFTKEGSGSIRRHGAESKACCRKST